MVLILHSWRKLYQYTIAENIALHVYCCYWYSGWLNFITLSILTTQCCKYSSSCHLLNLCSPPVYQYVLLFFYTCKHQLEDTSNEIRMCVLCFTPCGELVFICTLVCWTALGVTLFESIRSVIAPSPLTVSVDQLMIVVLFPWSQCPNFGG